MTKTDDTCQAATTLPPHGRGQAEYALLLITFLLSNKNGVRHVQCRGCREILPAAPSTPRHVRGTVELDGQPVPIIDANVWVYAEKTRIISGTCILIAERRWESRQLRGGVLISDIEEVMQLAAGNFDSLGQADASANMRLALDSDEKSLATLLVESHRELGLLDREWTPPKAPVGAACCDSTVWCEPASL